MTHKTNTIMTDRSAPKRRATSQTRQRKHRHVGHYTEREETLFNAAFERYRGSGAAAEYGGSESAFIRWNTIGYGARKLPRRRALPPDLLARLGGLMTELARQGNNLNQITRRLHEGTDGAQNALYTVLSENRQTLQALRQLAGLANSEDHS